MKDIYAYNILECIVSNGNCSFFDEKKDITDVCAEVDSKLVLV